MYTNENKFSFKDILFQFLFVALFIFILLLIFPNKDYMNNMKSELLNNNGNSSEQTSTLVTSAIFNQNITSMKEASILYFTTPRLPQKEGDTVKLTLKELLDKHLVVAPLDEDGNVCDTEKSYITMTKEKDEYVLKVNLKCKTEEDYILTYLGCYDYCKGTVCENKNTTSNTTKTDTKKDNTTPTNLSYQYEYKLNGRWSDWSSWSTWTTDLIKGSTSKEVDTKTKTTEDKITKVEATKTTTYTCPSGYILSGDKCIKSTEEIVTATVKKTYTCPTGYTYNGGTCKKGYISTVDASKKITYSCPSGYVINGTVCYKSSTSTIDATKVIKYSCSDGYTISGTSCVRTVKTITRQTYTSARSGSEYKLVSIDTRSACTGCAYITYYTYDITTTSTSSTAATSTTSYTCQAGYTLAGTKCVKTSEAKQAATTTTSDYSCPSGYKLSGDKCKKTVIQTASPDTHISYSCKDGYNLVEGVCVKGNVTKIDAEEKTKYTCSEGYTLNGTECTKVTKGTKTTYYRFRTRTYLPGDIQWRDTKTDKTLLSKGYYLTGNKRVKTSK